MDNVNLILLILASALAVTLFGGDAYRRHELSPLAIGAVVCWIGILGIASYLVWVVPKSSIQQLEAAAEAVSNDPAATSKDKLDAKRELLKAEAETRQALVGIIAGLVVIGGLYFTYRTLTGTARSSILQRYTESVALLVQSDAEKLAGVEALAAIDREPEGADLHIGVLLDALANDPKNLQTTAGGRATEYAKSAHK
jgi:hypothetical protein